MISLHVRLCPSEWNSEVDFQQEFVAHLCTSSCSCWNSKVPYSMPNLRKKREQNRRNYIENQESKKVAARASYNASPEMKRAAYHASYRADPEEKRPASQVASRASGLPLRVPLFKAYLRSCCLLWPARISWFMTETDSTLFTTLPYKTITVHTIIIKEHKKFYPPRNGRNKSQKKHFKKCTSM